MELPKFKYSPNAYKIDIFKSVEGICSVCDEKRNLKYESSFYSIDDPEYICPWCIADGSTSKKYDGEFNDYCGIEGISPDPSDEKNNTISKEHLLEVTTKTPSYNSWQQEVWLTHCNEPCAFIGYADSKMIEPYIDEVIDDIEESGYDLELIKNHLSKDSHLVGYLFQCVQCNQHRLHIDCD